MKEILTVIFQSNAMTYGTTQIEMKMLWLLSRGTKGGRTEEISTETHGLTGSRIYSLTGPDEQHITKTRTIEVLFDTDRKIVFI